MRYLIGSGQHIGGRQTQQDSYGVSVPSDVMPVDPGAYVAIVCDGMGGLENGDAASREAVAEFFAALRDRTATETVPEALARAVQRANERVLAAATQLDVAEGMGTTLVAIHLRGLEMHWISVGDSAIYLYRGGELEQLNHPHVFANLLARAVEQGALTQDQAASHPERESLTSYVGTATLVEIDASTEPLALSPGDTVILASDGLFKTLEVGEMLAAMMDQPESWPDTLVNRTMAKGRPHQDNVTVVTLSLLADAREVAAAPAPVAPSRGAGWWIRPVLVFLLVGGFAAVVWWYLSRGI